ncbi:hypothetical protein HAX54_012946, partial [Datura stramonium]|nr:hypothetical protein [Datura stramonium]
KVSSSISLAFSINESFPESQGGVELLGGEGLGEDALTGAAMLGEAFSMALDKNIGSSSINLACCLPSLFNRASMLANFSRVKRSVPPDALGLEVVLLGLIGVEAGAIVEELAPCRVGSAGSASEVAGSGGMTMLCGTLGRTH